MSRPWIRVSLVILMLAVFFTSGYRLFLSERQHNLDRETAEEYGSIARNIAVSLADLRSAQRAYVASGQDPSEWFERVATQFNSIGTGLDELRGMSLASETIEALGEAAAAVERLRRVDDAARGHTSAGQVLMASDLVFSDGQELVQIAASQLDIGRSIESEERSRLINRLRTEQVMTITAVTAISIVITLMLLPLPRRQTEPSTAQEELPSANTAEHSTSEVAEFQSASGLRASSLFELDLKDADGSRVAASATLPSSTTSSALVVVPNIEKTAQICIDLARVSERGELENMLGRVRDLLNASGLIVWVRDRSGNSLRPAMGHGYAPQLLSQLGRVSCDGDSATAAAYRTAQLQVVPSGDNGPGAVAVPLLSSSSNSWRCVGVLSAEVLQGWEASEAVRATASILAAQLGTLITADPVEYEGQTEAQG